MYPWVRLDHDNKYFYAAALDRRYLVNRCGTCGRWHTPPQPMCPDCWSWEVTPTEISGRGVLHLMTFLHQGPASAGVAYDPPFALGTIELDEQAGLRVSAPLANVSCGTRLGARMQLTWMDVRGHPFPAFTQAEPEELA